MIYIGFVKKIRKIVMFPNRMAERRPRGRPQLRSDEETRRMIIEAAGEEFRKNGYARTCMNDVACAAGVSTKTLYRLIPAKEELFSIFVTDRIDRFLEAVNPIQVDTLDIDDALERILIAYGTLTLSPETIGVNRLAIAESDRFPHIAATFYERAVMRINTAMAGWLRTQHERGLIELDDPDMAAGMLRGMMLMEPQRAVMMGIRPPPDAAEIAIRAKVCARTFLNGLRKKEAAF
jgi:AcrR family transcriptional regulator